jgi:hypothetical protein
MPAPSHSRCIHRHKLRGGLVFQEKWQSHESLTNVLAVGKLLEKLGCKVKLMTWLIYYIRCKPKNNGEPPFLRQGLFLYTT